MTTPAQARDQATPHGVPTRESAETTGAGGPVLEPAKTSLLRADHDLFEKLAEGIVRTIALGEPGDVSEAITLLQTSIGAHLDAEEIELIPRYAEGHPDDAASILKDHAAIRATLAGLDVETDLHLVRADAVRAFLAALRDHAARENAGLYVWAESTR